MHAGVLSAVFALFLSVADEPSTPPTPEEGEAYCRFVEGVARSEAALLRSPELFGSVGHFSAVGTSLEPAAGIQTTRILAGIRYDITHLIQGNLQVRRAHAECNRYRAMSRLEAALRDGSGGTLLPALAAKVAVLKNVLPSLLQRLEGLQDDVRNARATVEDLHAFRIRVDELRDAVSRSELQLAETSHAPRPASEPVNELLDDYWEADREVEEAEGAIRRVRAFGLELKGGYEELLTVDQGVPLFGVVGIRYNIGHLWQGASNRQAREARDSLRHLRGGSPGNHRIAESIRRLEATRGTQRRRLEEVAVLSRDIKAQLEVVEQMETMKVQRFRDYLWVESARLEAERIFLEKHVEELDRFLGTPAAEKDAPPRGPSVREEKENPSPPTLPTIHIRR